MQTLGDMKMPLPITLPTFRYLDGDYFLKTNPAMQNTYPLLRTRSRTRLNSFSE